MKTKLRVGVIGAGGIARSVHLPSLSQIEACDLRWICDLDVNKAREQAQKWNIPEYGTYYPDMLKKELPDAVYILVQPELTYRIAMECLRAGCHIFIEKPMGITRYQAESIAREARENHRQCQVGFNRRFIPLVQEVVARMRELGPIHQVDGWFYKNGGAAFYDGCSSAFYCDAIHTIDLVRHIAGSEARKAVRLSGRYGGSPVDNAWNALIAFENGITGTVHSNYATGGRVHGFAIHNSEASAYINIGFGGEACSATILHHVTGTFSLASNGAGEQHIETLDGPSIAGSHEYYHYYGYLRESQQFIDALLRDAPVPCGAEDALNTMRLLDQMSAGDLDGHYER